MEKYILELNNMIKEESHNKYITVKINNILENILKYKDLKSIETDINNIKEIIYKDEYEQMIKEVKKYIYDEKILEIIQKLDYDDLLHYCLLLKENNFIDADEFINSL